MFSQILPLSKPAKIDTWNHLNATQIFQEVGVDLQLPLAEISTVHDLPEPMKRLPKNENTLSTILSETQQVFPQDSDCLPQLFPLSEAAKICTWNHLNFDQITFGNKYTP